MRIQEEYELTKNLCSKLEEVEDILSKLDIRNAFDNRGFSQQLKFSEKLLQKKQIRNEVKENDSVSLTYIVNLLENNIDISYKGYCIDWGEYLVVKENSLYIDMYPWNFYGGVGDKRKNRTEITTGEGLTLVKKAIRKNKNKQEEEIKLENERKIEQEEFYKEQAERHYKEEHSFKKRLNNLFKI